MAEIGGKQLSTLLETLPGIASVLRSPVADALVGMIRAGAGLAEFKEADALELVQYATRRGLMGMDEGDRLIEEVKGRAKRSADVSKAPRGSRTKGAAKAAKAAVKKAKVVKKPAKKASAKVSQGKPARKKSGRKSGARRAAH